MSYTKTEELFDRCVELAETEQPSTVSNHYLHETLVLICAEGLKDSGQAYGNLFSQVDYLCKRCGISAADKMAIQTMRRHSNSSEPLTRETLLYDVRALSLLISAVFNTAVPDRLERLIPRVERLRERLRVGERSSGMGASAGMGALAEGMGVKESRSQGDRPYIRCIVGRWDDKMIYAESDEGEMAIDYTSREHGADHTYLSRIVREGMQLNLLDASVMEDRAVVRPRLIVVEPDFLVDVSSIAACFTDYGHHPLLYTVNRLRDRTVTQPMLLGHLSSTALDELIWWKEEGGRWKVEGGRWKDIVSDTFREQALQFCVCEDFRPQDFLRDASQQVQNLEEVVRLLFSEYDGGKAILEPSFVCERLGLQGRVDLMTIDMRLLVEQKSGKNMNIEHKHSNAHREDHYVQLLLYYGVLRYNFGVSDRNTDIRLLYSRYPAREGLLVVNFYQQLFREAIKFRNQLVATEYHIARQGFGSILPHLNVKTIYGDARRDPFFTRFIEPSISHLASRISHLTPLEHAYFTRMMTFVYREQLYAKVGGQEGRSTAIADLWNMPLSEKKDTGNIYTGLTLTDRRRSADYSGYDLLTLAVPDQGADFLPNFRRGDMVSLYAYQGEPDITRSILFKGTILEITSTQLVVKLSDGQRNPDIFSQAQYALEHGTTEMSTTSNIRSLWSFITGPADKRALLLGQRPPEADTTLTLSRNYHPDYDEIVLKAKQARDYFLLIGPPGTGKTSMALRFLVAEHLSLSTARPAFSILLSAYTNRAVDEICGMLEDVGFDYFRIGNESSCDPRFAHRLIEQVHGEHPRLEEIRRRILDMPVIVSTTSMLLARSYILKMKQFDLAIIDEASQILEPNLVGLLSRVRKFILIGDYKQLPAVVQQPECESVVTEPCLREIGLTDCRRSLFERLVERLRVGATAGMGVKESRSQEGKETSPFIGILRKQGRMHPDIAAFPNQMFYFREQLQPVPCPHQLDTSLGYDLPSQDALDDQLKQRRIIFIDSFHPFPPLTLRLPVAFPPSSLPPARSPSDKVNPAEARLVADLLRRISRFYGNRFDATRSVGVIVPYRNQIALIRREVEQLGIPRLAAVSIDTVERYQGSQRDVIIYSFTASHSYQLDFLTGSCFEQDGRVIDRRLNVAITRARKQMILTGCERVLRENPIFSQLIDFCQ